jgi:two-component system NarL family response regulator
MAAAIRILIVDDHPVVRAGLSAMIEPQADMRIVAQAGDGQEALDLFRRHQPDLTLMDLRLPVMSGVDAIGAIRSECPASRIIVLSAYTAPEDVYQALHAGAHGYLPKSSACEAVLEAIRAVHAGQRRIPESVASRLAERMSGPELTPRERAVLELIAKGKPNRDIAESLGIREGTVKGHVNSLLAKLGVRDRTQAALAALERGLVHQD